jgi:hypothetical protein
MTPAAATIPLVVGFVLAGLAALVDIVIPGSTGRTRTAVHLCAALSSVGFVVAGAAALTGAPARLPVAALLDWPSRAPGVEVDALSGLFLVISFGSRCRSRWRAPRGRPEPTSGVDVARARCTARC